jgi:hypothetical protein
MKNKFKILYIFFGVVLFFTACMPKDYELGALMDKSALKFTVTPSSKNPNDIVLESLVPKLTPSWITPFGQSTKFKDTINVPFPGTYKFVFGVESDGGLVQADTTFVTITTIDQKAVSDSMWINLTGGLGKSKTWVYDLDANGVSKYFTSPFYFGGSWGEWDPAWKDIGWSGVKAGDYGTMTFDLIGNANFKSDNKMFPELSGTGTFMLYPATKELSTNGAQLIRDRAEGDKIANWYAKMKVKALDADHLQVIALIDDKNWLFYNYISKDYYDSH